MALMSIEQGIQDAQLRQQTLDAIEAARPIVGDAVALCRREYLEARWLDIGDDPAAFAASCRAMIQHCAHTDIFEDIIGKED